MKVALVGPTDRSIWAFRRGLICALHARGHDVSVVCDTGEYVDKIESLGARHIPVAINRFMSPTADLSYLQALLKVFRQEAFDLLHTFTVKPNLYGAVAGRLAGVKRIYALIEGLGFGYPETSGLKPAAMRFAFLNMYRVACTLADKVWFINSDDMNLFLRKRIISREKAVFIRSIGVDSEEYSPERVDAKKLDELKEEFGGDSPGRFVSEVARMNWSKGVREFVEAAALLQGRHPNVKFLLVGEIQEGSPDTVPRDYLESHSKGNFLWLGFRSDVKEILALSDIVVLPSFYREGVPRSLHEGMSMGKPIVTTDHVGCREVVRDGVNGCLVPVRDAGALANAVGKLLDSPDKCIEFGRKGREWVEQELDEKMIVERVIKELYGLQ